MGDRLEERKDFTVEVSAKLPEAKKLAQVSLTHEITPDEFTIVRKSLVNRAHHLSSTK